MTETVAVALGVGLGAVAVGELSAQQFPVQQLSVQESSVQESSVQESLAQEFSAQEAGGALDDMVRLPAPAPLAPVRIETPPAGHAEPFGVQTAPLRHGGLWRKWHAVTKSLSGEKIVLARCRSDRADCPRAADRFLAVIDKALTREGRARIGEINRAINLDIRPADDLAQYGVVDFWASPLTTFASGAGDCEDYAIAKYVALREAGIAREDLRLVVVRDHRAGEYHAVAAVRFEGRWLVLDNRGLAMREDAELTWFTPLFLIDDQGLKRLRRPPTAPSAPAVASVATERDGPVQLAGNL